MSNKNDKLISERNRHLMRFICGALIVLIEAALFYYVWTHFYNPFVRRPYLFKGNWFITAVYVIVLLIFGSIYGGMKLGYYKVIDIILSQSLSAIITNAVIYIAMIIPIATWYLSPMPLILMSLGDIVLTVIWAIISNRIFVRIFKPQRLVLLYGSHEDTLYAKFITRPDRYRICESIDAENAFKGLCASDALNASIDPDAEHKAENASADRGSEARLRSLIEGLSDYDGVVIGDINAELRNDILKTCFAMKLRTYTLPKITDVILKSSETLHIFDSPVFLSRNHGLSIEQRFVKRSFDLILSGLALIILSPLLLIISLLIRLEDGGPVFFRQDRCTKDGRVFSIL